MFSQTLLILCMAVINLLIGKDFIRSRVVFLLFLPIVLVNCLEHIETIMFLL